MKVLKFDVSVYFAIILLIQNIMKRSPEKEKGRE